MALSIKIENFEGPFDLLLHLIKKSKMSIYDIKLNEITKQYLEYLRNMKEMDLEITSEFIVIASTLLEIKSRELLPKPPKEDEEELDENDIKKQLISKLIEYKKFKMVASFFKERETDTGITFSKKPEIIEDKKQIDISQVLKNVTMLDLYNLFNELMFVYISKINVENKIPKEISLDKFKIEDKMEELYKYIIQNKRLEFSNVIKKSSSKMEAIVTFLAMLEMIRLRTINIYQEGNFNEIYIEGADEDA